MAIQSGQGASRPQADRVVNRLLLAVLILTLVLIASQALASGAFSRANDVELAPGPFRSDQRDLS